VVSASANLFDSQYKCTAIAFNEAHTSLPARGASSCAERVVNGAMNGAPLAPLAASTSTVARVSAPVLAISLIVPRN